MSKRQELLRELIEKMSRAIHSIHVDQCFSFGNNTLRKQEIMILFFVYENKGVSSVKDIANFLHVTSGAITQFTDGLVEKKIVQREENPDDRRSINIKLTAGSEKMIVDFRKKYIESASKSFDFFSDKELEQFIKLIEKIKTKSSK
jgi:DNA-binding MarR family transcriptional regulator